MPDEAAPVPEGLPPAKQKVYQVNQIQDRHREACKMKLEGLTLREIGKRLKPKKSVVTMKQWFRSPVMKAELARMKAWNEESKREGVRREYLAKPKEAERVKADADLFYFLTDVLGYDRLERRIHGPLCDILMDPVLSRRLAVMLPRSWFKSTICSIGEPIWGVTRDPNQRVLLVQNTGDNAAEKLSAIRGHFDSNEKFRDLYKDLLPHAKCRWGADALEVSRTKSWPEPTFSAAGVRTRLTGKHFNKIIQDDTAAPELQDLGDENLIPPTVDQVQRAIGFHRLVTPLLVDADRDSIRVVGTRWYELDLLRYIQDKQKQYHVFQRAVREKGGQSDPDGDLVWPERFNDVALAELASDVGPYFFSALYLNNPLPASDMVFRNEWVQYFDETEFEKVKATGVALQCVTVVDVANDPAITKRKPDYNVVLTAYKNMETGEIYVRDYFRERCSPNRTVDAIVQHVKTYSPTKLGIESIGFQRMLSSPIKERLRHENLYVTVEELQYHAASKEHRIQGLQPLFAGGKIKIKKQHAALVQELLSFPRGKNDDVIDALSMLLRVMGLTWQGVEAKPTEVADQFSVESIIAGIRRRTSRVSSPVMDVLRPRFSLR